MFIKVKRHKLKIKNILDYDENVKQTAKFYDYILPRYNEIFPKHIEGQKDLAKFLYNSFLKGKKRICDVACGNGALLYQLYKLNNDFELYGYDASKEGVNLSNKLLKGINARIKQMDWLRIKGGTHLFDALICTGNAIAHLPPSYLEQVVNRFADFIAPKGLLIIDTYSDAEWRLCESQKIIPRSIIKKNSEFHVVIFSDQFQEQNSLKYTIKSVDYMKFDKHGLPKSIESFEVIQFVIKAHDLLNILNSVNRFKNIKQFQTNQRFVCFSATKS